MAKKKTQSENIRYAVNKKALKNARAKAALEQAQLQERMEKREKSRRMSTAFLLGVLAAICLFCLYTVVRTFLFRADASVEALRTSLLFVSIVSIPCLLGGGVFLIHRLLKKRRENWSDRAKQMSKLLLILAIVAAFLLFGIQFRGARSSAAAHPAYTGTLAALEQSGLQLETPEEPTILKTLLEDSLSADLRCGQTQLRLNYHAGGSGWIAHRFLEQAAGDYADCSVTENGGWTLWSPAGTEASARAAAAFRSGNTIRVIELAGPRAELETLLPLLARGAAD